MKLKAFLFSLLRSSEFYAAIGQALLETVAEAHSTPLPSTERWVVWGYTGFRFLSKLVKFVFPNGASGEWFADDSTSKEK